jgi:hypothetical protein
MSGLDEQIKDPLSRLNYDSVRHHLDYEKWVYGVFECQKCGHKIYHDVPYWARREVEFRLMTLEYIKRQMRKHIRKVYGIKVNEVPGFWHKGCGGKTHYHDLDITLEGKDR